MLWAALQLPSFALDRLGVRPRDPALVVAAPVGRRQVVVHASAAARRAGVHPGQAVASARSLCGELVVRPHDPPADRRALHRLALALHAFTPVVAVVDDTAQGGPALLLEIAASVPMFGGLTSLLAAARHPLRRSGYRVRVGCAPTPLAALGLARAGRPEPVTELADLPAAVAGLPVASLPLDAEVIEALHALGVTRWEALDALPRAGLRARFEAASRRSPALLDVLDRAYGRIPDPRPPVEAPLAFHTALDLPFEAERADALLFVGTRMIEEMCAFLAYRELAVTAPVLQLHHGERARTDLVLGLARPTARSAAIARILRERLDRLRLPAPVRAVALQAGPFTSATASVGDLFRADGSSEQVPWLLARLRARWGEAAVHGVGTAPDHRPERAWRRVAPGEPSPPLSVGERPLWLLEPPQPLGEVLRVDGQALRLCTRAERVEAGWWDEAPVARDYHVARTDAGRQAWVFRDLEGGDWFLHGWFG